MNPNWRHIVREHLAVLRLPPEREIEIVEEQALHLESAYEDALADGLSEAEAEARAVQSYDWRLLECELGRVEQPILERVSQSPLELIERKGGMRMESFIQDLRFGARMLIKNPGFTLVAVLSLALGIGANTAIFSLLDALLLKPLPVKQPEQLVIVGTDTPSQPGRGFSSFSYPVFREMREKNSVFSGMFARSGLQMSLSGSGQTERVQGEVVSGNFFSALGVNPLLGRLLTEADDQTPGAHPVAVISFNFWQRRFGADPQIVGKTISLNGYPFTIIGVAQQGFYGVEVGAAPDVRIPLMMDGQVRPKPGAPIFEQRGNWWLSVMARVNPGVSVEQAQAAADAVFQIAREPDIRRNKGDSLDDRNFKSLRIHLVSAKTGASNLSRQFSQPLVVLMCLVGMVLLIACLNIANLLLARATMRQKEIAVRLAMGAGRFRLARQLLTEGFLLSALGGLLGLLFARWGTDALLGFLPQGRALEINPDLRMLGFTLSVTLLSGLLFGLAPALQATRPNLIPALKNDAVVVVVGRRRWELGRLLVTLQVALSLVLLVGAGLFARSLRNLKMVDNGYNTDQVVTMALDPAQSGYKIERLRNFYSQLSERLAALPGVKTTTFTRNVPMSGSYSRFGIEVPGYQPRPGEEMAVLFNQIGPQFFATFGAPLSLGREFTSQDTPESPKVVIVNHSLARYFFGAENPLGRRITLENYKDLEIVGVVADAKYRNLREAAPRTAYIPYSQYDTLGQRILCVRAAGDTDALVAAIRREARSLDPNLPVFNVKTFAEQVNESVSGERLVALLSSFFGFFALLLAALGLYGVMAYAVTRRTRELGVRIALGAQTQDVLILVLKQGMKLTGLGVALGLIVALGVTRLTKSLLFGVSATDPLTFLGTVLLLVSVALLACWIPGRRATRVDPLTVLRHE
jgi:putative ABC transport system permease protein